MIPVKAALADEEVNLLSFIDYRVVTLPKFRLFLTDNIAYEMVSNVHLFGWKKVGDGVDRYFSYPFPDCACRVECHHLGQ
jgi:hypothetical protein